MTKNLLDLNGKELDAELERIIKKNPPRERKWTEKEIQIALSLKGKVSIRVIAKTLGRSTTSVQHKLLTF